jgi:hypothetical protein
VGRYKKAMNAYFHMCLRLLLIACFVISGSFAQAGMSENGASFLMELCADGVAQTIRIDANGNPVDPAAPCCECLTCVQLAAAAPNPQDMAAVILLSYGFVTDTIWTTPLLVNTPDTCPLPRGPPLVTQSAMIIAAALYDDHKRSMGRPYFKDALA